MRHPSDVNERTPLFADLHGAVSTAQQEGLYDGLPFDMERYVDGMRPAGLDHAGALVYPRSYNPNDGPAVLMTKPEEKGSLFHVPGVTLAEAALAATIVMQAQGIDTVSINRVVRRQVQTTLNGKPAGNVALGVFGQYMDIASLNFTLDPDETHTTNRPLRLPRFLLVNPRDGSGAEHAEYAAITTGKELTHWNYYTNEQGPLQGSEHWYGDTDWLNALIAKKGHLSVYKIAENLGHTAVLFTPERLLERAMSYHPVSQDELVTDILRDYPKPSEFDTHVNEGVAMGVKAMELRHGKPGVPLTQDEFTGLMDVAAFTPQHTQRWS